MKGQQIFRVCKNHNQMRKTLEAMLDDEWWWDKKPYVDAEGIQRPGVIKSMGQIKAHVKKGLESDVPKKRS